MGVITVARQMGSGGDRIAERAAEVIEEHDQIADREHELQLAHIGRLNKGTMETIDTSDIHMNVVSNLSRISSHARMLAQVVRGDPR